MKLGWGLGLGSAGPFVLAGTVALGGYAFYRYRKNQKKSLWPF